MTPEQNLIIAKQQANQAKGLNFYVTKTGIKRDANLLGGKYIYKVYFKNGIHVEDSKGVIQEKPKAEKTKATRKTTISSDMRDIKDETVSEDAES